MGWIGRLTADSKVGDKISFTPDATKEGEYDSSSFTAPVTGVYRFQLYGSGGTDTGEPISGMTVGAHGGKGGSVNGYRLLKAGETVYVGAGGTCCAAFVAEKPGENVASFSDDKSALLFVAGGGAGGSRITDEHNNTGWNCMTMTGGMGGGSIGGEPEEGFGGNPGGDERPLVGATGGGQGYGGLPGGTYSTKSGLPGTFGTGAAGVTQKVNRYTAISGRGGDGYYGGGSGDVYVTEISAHGYGGGGGSGYVKPPLTFTAVNKKYTSSTVLGGGKEHGRAGEIVITYTARGLLPVFFDKTQLERIIFNGKEIAGLTYNGKVIYARRWRECLRSMAERFACRAATQGSSHSASMA